MTCGFPIKRNFRLNSLCKTTRMSDCCNVDWFSIWSPLLQKQIRDYVDKNRFCTHRNSFSERHLLICFPLVLEDHNVLYTSPPRHSMGWQPTSVPCVEKVWEGDKKSVWSKGGEHIILDKDVAFLETCWLTQTKIRLPSVTNCVHCTIGCHFLLGTCTHSTAVCLISNKDFRQAFCRQALHHGRVGGCGKSEHWSYRLCPTERAEHEKLPQRQQLPLAFMKH